MKAYKLTDSDGRTKNGTQWGENITHTAIGTGTKLCSDGWIHFYTDPLIAVFMNPIHAAFNDPILWECETSGEELHEPLKSGCKTLTTIKQIELPYVTNTQRIAFGILCAKQVCKDARWNKWADDWLNNINRKRDAAYTAHAAADAAAGAHAAAAAADAAAYAAAAAALAAAATGAKTTINFVEIAKKAMTYE